MTTTTTRPYRRRPLLGDVREDPACPALWHRHSRIGYRADGCRCPSTIAAWERSERILAEARRAYEAGRQGRRRERRAAERERRIALGLEDPDQPSREIDDCPATRHRHDAVLGYYHDGCRCPSTIKAHERRLETVRAANRRWRENNAGRITAQNMAAIDLRRADRRDAEAIAQGYRLPRCSMHTRGLAVRMMRENNPALTDRQIAWKLTAAGQGRMVSRDGAPPVYEDVSERQVQRILTALAFKQLKRPGRAGSRLDRSGRTR